MNSISKLFSLLVLLPVTACATYSDETAPQDIKDFHYPKSGVIIVPPSQIDIPPQFKKKIELNALQMKTKGFYDSSAPDAQNLLGLKKANVVALQNSSVADPNDPKDTHMKSSIAAVRAAFSYPGIASIPQNNVIGYAAGGMWLDGKGWTGIKEFFDTDELGTCSLFISNMALAHGNVRIGEDSVKYVVNNKAGTNEVYGSNKTGYTYNVSWYDSVYSHELECATPTFVNVELDKLIELANVIDKQLSRTNRQHLTLN
jgi:hypothetical protein